MPSSSRFTGMHWVARARVALTETTAVLLKTKARATHESNEQARATLKESTAVLLKNNTHAKHESNVLAMIRSQCNLDGVHNFSGVELA